MGWFIAFVLLLAVLVYRARLQRLTRESRATEDRAAQLRDLTYLRLQAPRLCRAGQISADQQAKLLKRIDKPAEEALLGLYRDGQALDPETERARLRLAWKTLHQLEGSRLGPTPWHAWPPEPEPPAAEAEPALTPPAAAEAAEPALELDLCIPELEPEAAPTPEPPAATPQPRPPPAPEPSAQSEGQRHAWAPQLPNALEQALGAFSRLPRALLPFLLQNVGWFIGAFCFVSGSIFLVAYTSGFAQTLIIYASLLAYTLFLIWAGYRLRVKRRELGTASGMLLTIGMLLVPLNLSTSARVLVESGSGPRLLLGLSLALVTLGLFMLAARLVSGINERALQREHPRLLLLLSAYQLGLPLLLAARAWPLLALAHALILATLAYAVWRFAEDWVRSIFLERRKLAYFAAGTLVYAALVSFVHLTWGSAPLTLPRGYYGPYLMALCALLLYLDAKVKGLAGSQPLLSRLNFFVYGLSVVAVLAALEGPAARLLTLALAAALYAGVTWRYLTLIPLYLLLAALAALYHQLLLQHFTPAWWLLLALPGLLLLLAASRRIEALSRGRPGGRRLAVMSYRAFVLLLLSSAAVSLLASLPSALASLNALALAATLWWALGSAPGPLLPSRGEQRLEADFGPAGLDLRNSAWLYLVTLALALAWAAAPPLGLIGPAGQLAVGLLALAWVWTWWGLARRDAAAPGVGRQVEVLLNSTLLAAAAVLAALGYGLTAGDTNPLLLPPLLAVLAGLLLGLSLALYNRGLFYLCLALAAAAAVGTKLLLRPGPDTGLLVLLAGLGLWLLLQWLDRLPDALTALRRQRAERLPPQALLWIFRRAEPAARNQSQGAPDA